MSSGGLEVLDPQTALMDPNSCVDLFAEGERSDLKGSTVRAKCSATDLRAAAVKSTFHFLLFKCYSTLSA